MAMSKKKKQHENQFDNCAELLYLAQETEENSVLLTYLMSEINNSESTNSPMRSSVQKMSLYTFGGFFLMLYHVTRITDISVLF